LLFVVIATKAQMPTKFHSRRLAEDAPVNQTGIMDVLKTLAGNLSLKLDVNQAFDQVKAAVASASIDGALVINMTDDDFEFCVTNDVMKCFKAPGNCGSGHVCHLVKTNLPLSSKNMKVLFNGKANVAQEGMMYIWDGKGLSLKGTTAAWHAAAAKRLRRLAGDAAPANVAGITDIMNTIAGNLSLKIDVNQAIQQVIAACASSSIDGALFVNMTDEHFEYCVQNDVFKCIKAPLDCAPGHTCHLTKTNLPLGSKNMRVTFNGKAAMAQEGMMYFWDGKGLGLKGTTAAWHAAAAKGLRRRRLLHRLH